MEPQGLLPCSKQPVNVLQNETKESIKIHFILPYNLRQGLPNDPIIA